MKHNKILISGDYWHGDFRDLLSTIDVPMTMTPIEKVSMFEHTQDQFDLILLAQSRRDQIGDPSVEILKKRFPGVPIVFLLGSWCEGESRSGEPIPGIVRIYWHQWNGQFAEFIQQLAVDGITNWHAPSTTTIADRIEKTVSRNPVEPAKIIGVSAWTETQFEMVADALKTSGFRSRWLERSTWDAQAITLLSAICVDANSLTDDLTNRLNWLKATFPGRPLILILNFPRVNEVASAKKLGVSSVVSKPFELAQLAAAVKQVTETAVNTGSQLIT